MYRRRPLNQTAAGVRRFRDPWHEHAASSGSAPSSTRLPGARRRRRSRRRSRSESEAAHRAPWAASYSWRVSEGRGANDTLDGARLLATPSATGDSSTRRADSAASSSGRAIGGGPAWREVRGGKLDFEGCRWFDHQVVAAVTVTGVSAIDVFFAESWLGGARVALAEGTVRHRLVAVFAGGCAPGGRLVHVPGAGVALRSAQRWLLYLAAVFQRALVDWRLNDGCRGQSTVRG